MAIIETLIKNLYLLTFILLPFNGLPYFQNYLGEIAAEGALYPLYFVVLLGIFCGYIKKDFKFPSNLSFVILGMFLCWVLLSSLVNFETIVSAIFKNRTGVEKLLKQLLLLSFSIAISIITYNLYRTRILHMYNVRRLVLFSVFVPGLFSILELLMFKDYDFAIYTFNWLSPYIRDTSVMTHNFIYYRIRSVCGEPSWFGIFAGFSFPWLFSYIYCRNRYLVLYFFIIGYFIALLLLTTSRTAYIILLVQIILYFFAVVLAGKRRPEMIKKFLYFLLLLITVVMFCNNVFGRNVFADKSMINVFLSLTGKSDNSVEKSNDYYGESNDSRTTMRDIAIKMTRENPVAGVGLGQYGFYIDKFLPKGDVNREVRNWASDVPGTSWPPVHNLFARIAAELGFLGLILWSGIWLSIMLSCLKKHILLSRLKFDHVGLALLISISGVLLTGFSSDSFRFPGYWILLGLAWAYLEAQEGEIIAEGNNN